MNPYYTVYCLAVASNVFSDNNNVMKSAKEICHTYTYTNTDTDTETYTRTHTHTHIIFTK